jgi:hypothetical protein
MAMVWHHREEAGNTNGHDQAAQSLVSGMRGETEVWFGGGTHDPCAGGHFACLLFVGMTRSTADKALSWAHFSSEAFWSFPGLMGSPSPTSP